MNTRLSRIVAIDYARALAILGMIIVNYKIAMEATQSHLTWLNLFTRIFEGRASALFVILAGFGISLMTRRARISKESTLIRKNRQQLYYRSLFLLIAGFVLLLVGWNADILHYYAVFMILGSLLITASDRLLVRLIILILVSSQLFLIVFNYGKGWDSSFHEYIDFWTLQGFFRNLFLNGFHPLFPWFSFFLIGMWLGRKDWTSPQYRKKIFLLSLTGTFIFEIISYLCIRFSSPWLDYESATYLFTTKPMPPTTLYICSATCSALCVLTACFYIVDKTSQFWLTRSLISTGQLSLTHYIGHILIGLEFLQLIGYLENKNVVFSTCYAFLYFVVALIFSSFWRKRVDRGPIEFIMRKCC
ncbi:heparan-alpha-glucosaminide N-acetyltransferase domain-containing protein [Paenibacillus kyungheensis]|uniref:Heparan-alpha-glucosaminide N-acetyltransferase domain-containing protein n=1 Tax=Paenibacillus kyungheensis TaxID=1452732 RepID=A0AAX3M2K9_9BACL|nr:heparan-alpha-glucosaminide N-acetyltransferase domain-containing protein [Paenibacillus kyungheensis]WCT56041.1 heparan-alpha-glucosaminide N-acetyltransferase domain-containing protein [Paenibacillus kyungheensis]